MVIDIETVERVIKELGFPTETTIQKIGIGKALLVIKVDGLLEIDWEHLKKVIALVENDEGEKEVGEAKFFKLKDGTKVIAFTYESYKTGIHTAKAIFYFKDGSWMKTHKGFTFLVEDA
jgi:ADP-glucose pyrophosphorylase